MAASLARESPRSIDGHNKLWPYNRRGILMKNEYPQRKHVRSPHWDYRQTGIYAVTICAEKRACIFGTIRDGRMNLAEIGRLIETVWLELPSHYTNIQLDEFVVMPNHLHGIVIIGDGPVEHHDAVVGRSFGNIQAGSLSSIVRAFKAGVSREAGTRIWQAGFFEHVIRDDFDLSNQRQYILDNPAKWEHDRENPDFVGP